MAAGHVSAVTRLADIAHRHCILIQNTLSLSLPPATLLYHYCIRSVSPASTSSPLPAKISEACRIDQIGLLHYNSTFIYISGSSFTFIIYLTYYNCILLPNCCVYRPNQWSNVSPLCFSVHCLELRLSVRLASRPGREFIPLLSSGRTVEASRQWRLRT